MNKFQRFFFTSEEVNHPNERSLKILKIFKEHFPCEVMQLFRYSSFDTSFSGVMQYQNDEIKSLQHIHEYMHINEYVHQTVKSNKVHFLNDDNLQVSIGGQYILPIIIENIFVVPISIHDVVIAFISGTNVKFEVDDDMMALADDFKTACSQGLRHIDQKEKTNFTEREIAIIQYISYGYSTKEIAEYMNFSEANIKYFVKNVMDKTESKNRTEAVSKLFRLGILK